MDKNVPSKNGTVNGREKTNVWYVVLGCTPKNGSVNGRERKKCMVCRYLKKVQTYHSRNRRVNQSLHRFATRKKNKPPSPFEQHSCKHRYQSPGSERSNVGSPNIQALVQPYLLGLQYVIFEQQSTESWCSTHSFGAVDGTALQKAFHYHQHRRANEAKML